MGFGPRSESDVWAKPGNDDLIKSLPKIAGVADQPEHELDAAETLAHLNMNDPRREVLWPLNTCRLASTSRDACIDASLLPVVTFSFLRACIIQILKEG